MNKKSDITRVAFYVTICILSVAIGTDAFLLYQNAFDFPYYDEWQLFPVGSFQNVFRVFNENMQVFFELASEFMFFFFDWNLRYFCFLSFGVYCLLAGIYFYIVRKQVKPQCWWVPLCFLPLFTPALGYNWLWPLLMQTHTYVLFFLLAVYFGFCKDDKWWQLGLFILFTLCSVAAMNVPLAVGIIGIFATKEIVNMKSQSLRSWGRIVLPLVIFGLAEGLFFWSKFSVTFQQSQFVNVFSRWYLELISFYAWNSLSLFWLADASFGNLYIGLFLVHVTLLGCAFLEQYRQKERQGLWAIIGAVMFNVCAVVALRHGEVYQYGFSFIRHNEVAFMMIPATLCVFLISQKRYLRIYGGILLILILAGYAANVSKSKNFSFFADLLYKNTCLCMNHYYNLKTIDTWQCQNSFYIPVDEQMQDAKNKNLHFVQTMQYCF